MTLTEFLLARIAEDETLARFVESDSATTLTAPSHYWASRSDMDENRLVLTVDYQRALAECEAKRRIVNMWADPFGQWNAPQADAARAQKDSTLRLLALPYADHPDYDEKWRP